MIFTVVLILNFKLAHSYDTYICLPLVIDVGIVIPLTLAVNAALDVQAKCIVHVILAR